MPNGVALMHPRRPLSNILGEPVMSLGVSNQGIPFGGRRGLTHVFFLICSTDDRGHLHTLARLTRLFQDDEFVPKLRDVDDAVAAKEIFDQTESDLEDV
jgi:PTS system nitrogen regulatory IIA component